MRKILRQPTQRGELSDGYHCAIFAGLLLRKGIRSARLQLSKTVPDGRMHFLRTVFFIVSVTFASIAADKALADIAVRIDLTRQEMNVVVDGVPFATWPVSTARRGYRTPEGVYTPYLLKRMHYSKLYDYTPMPYSIFFLRGYAIHGTTEVRSLGRPVSHGCVRLKTANAKALFGLIASQGLQNITISVTR